MPEQEQEGDIVNEKKTIPIDKSELVNILNDEISDIDSENKRAGWTHWALIGTLAGAIWLFFGELQKNTFVTHNVFYCLICILLICDWFSLPSSPSKLTSQKSNENRFKSMGFNSHRLAVIYFLIFRISLLCFLAFVLSKTANQSIPFALFIYCLIYLTVLLLGVLAIQFDIVLFSSKNEQDKKTNIASAVFLLSWAISIFLYIYKVNESIAASLSVIDIRYSALIFAIIQLVYLLLSHASIPPLYFRLKDIKRNLIWGKIKTSEAASQMEIAILGLKFSELFQEDIREVLAIVEQDCGIATKIQRDTILCLNLSQTIADTVVGKEYSDQQFDEYTAAKSAYESYTAKFDAKFFVEKFPNRITFRKSRIELLRSRSKLKASILIANDSALKAEYDLIDKQIVDGIQRLDETQKPLISYLKQLEKSIALVDEASKRFLHSKKI